MLQENLVQRFTEAVRDNWDGPAYTDYEGATLRYADLAQRILMLHQVFRECGVRRGDRIAVVGRNCSHWGVAYFAAITYGAVVVPILHEFTGEEIHHCVTHSEAVLLFAGDTVYDRLQDDRMRKVKGIFRLEDFSLRSARDRSLKQAVEAAERLSGRVTRADFRLEPIPGDQLATIIYTSGTTGFSKGVMLDLHSLMVNVRFYLDQLDMRANKRIVSFLPLAHCLGCAFDLIAPTVAGAHITFIGKTPTPKVLLGAFQQIRPRVVLSVPLIIEKIYRNTVKPKLDKKSLRVMLGLPILRDLVLRQIRDKVTRAFGGAFQEVVIGGAAFNYEAEMFFRKIGFPLSNGYGMTECGPLISFSLSTDNPPLGSVGRIIPYLECKIDVTDPAHGVGEVLVRGENVMKGYYKDPEATAATIDADGWLHTGDLGHLDVNGFLFLTGRSKNLILTATGQNVYPEEIEARLNNLPYVMESLVLDHDGRIEAIVYPDLDKADQHGIDEKAIEAIMEQNRKTLNEMIPKYAAVTRISATFEEFEKTATRKIKRRLYSLG
jgi:long-chain acyl-CoA synthetase